LQPQRCCDPGVSRSTAIPQPRGYPINRVYCIFPDSQLTGLLALRRSTCKASRTSVSHRPQILLGVEQHLELDGVLSSLGWTRPRVRRPMRSASLPWGPRPPRFVGRRRVPVVYALRVAQTGNQNCPFARFFVQAARRTQTVDPLPLPWTITHKPGLCRVAWRCRKGPAPGPVLSIPAHPRKK
jgi:hypothetical protein